MRQLFVEVNPFHAETLLPYHHSVSRSADDLVLGHRRLFGQPLFDVLPARKAPLAISTFVGAILRERIRDCHFNTIGATLAPLTRETLRLNLTLGLLVVVARLLGCRVTALVHEAEQFFATGHYASRRQRLFQRLIGRWFIRLFRRLYVLSPEVGDFLAARGVEVELLSGEGLARFARALGPGSSPTPTVVWIGPVQERRRNWKLLLDLDGERMAALGGKVLMLCDSRVAEGPLLKREVERRGLASCFTFLDHRPDDVELFRAARDAAAVLCLYGADDYGRSKTSGARFIARALGKPFIANRPQLGVYEPGGSQAALQATLTDCIEHALALAPTFPSTRVR